MDTLRSRRAILHTAAVLLVGSSWAGCSAGSAITADPSSSAAPPTASPSPTVQSPDDPASTASVEVETPSTAPETGALTEEESRYLRDVRKDPGSRALTDSELLDLAHDYCEIVLAQPSLKRVHKARIVMFNQLIGSRPELGMTWMVVTNSIDEFMCPSPWEENR